MFQPENLPKKYEVLFTEIDTGRTKIPKFQREFVWSKSQTAKLIDSLIKGYPIGTFILWKTRDELRYFKNIGNIELPEIPRGDYAYYVLDGQQRITSLYAVRKGAIITKEGEIIDYKDIFINLDLALDADEEVVITEEPEGSTCISVHKLLAGKLVELLEEYSKDHLTKIDTYQNRLRGYDFSTIVISDYPIDVACEVFTRINTGGTELTLFEIMVAKTYDQKKDFDLAEKYELLINSNGNAKDLETVGYDTIPSSIVLQCIAAHNLKTIRRKDILKLKKGKVVNSWETVKDGIFTSIDYMRAHLRIPVSKLLPYNMLLVPFSYFFIKMNGEKPSQVQNKLLTQYFWWASLSNRFASGAEGKVALDLKKMDKILKEIAPSYKGDEVELGLEDLMWHWFSTGEAFCKAILCLYSYFEPKSFSTNSSVRIDNAYLKVAFSKNYHHFFPKSYLKKQGYKDWEANTILNITIVDEHLNKKSIGAKAPSTYMKKFARENSDIKKTMKTHLITNLDSYGIWDDNYETFLKKRGQKVIMELEKRLKPEL